MNLSDVHAILKERERPRIDPKFNTPEGLLQQIREMKEQGITRGALYFYDDDLDRMSHIAINTKDYK